MDDFNMNRSDPPDVDAALLELATTAVQAQERLHLAVKRVNDANSALHESSCRALDTLKEMRSEIEGTVVAFEKTLVDDGILQHIRQLILMHVPHSLTPEVKNQLQELIIKAFHGTCNKVLFAGLITCHWYRATQGERGQQAKHNSLVIVYRSKDRQFFAPVNPHIKEKDSEVIDHGWFYAAEAFHFANYLVKGKTRFVEAMLLPEEAVIFTSDEWQLLRHSVTHSGIQGLRGFMEQCRGQAVGTVSKKSKSTGKMKLRDGATLYEFCESFRLLQHASNTLAGNLLCMNDPTTAGLPQTGQDAVNKLCQIYQEDSGITKEDLLKTLLAWRAEVDKAMHGFKFTDAKLIDSQVGQWLSAVRTGTHFVPKSLEVSSGQLENLCSLMASVGGPVNQMKPEQILMVARAGSYLYGLSTPQSDVDYLVVYARPTEEIISTTKCLSESVENRGPKLAIEYGAYEARLFCEMLWKGSVVIAELIFVDEVEYMSSAWKALISQHQLFTTERLILQYFGLIKNNMTMIENGKHKDTPREKKIFYQIFHKLASVEDLLHYRSPSVRVTGQTRDFIMRIRTGPLEGDISSERLYDLARQKITQLRSDLANRTQRLPENVDFHFLTDWLISVRGWVR